MHYGQSSGLRRAVPPMPRASTIECIRTLVRLGWMPAWWTERECRLEKGPLAFTVRLDPELSSEQVSTIVKLAGVMPITFVDALERVVTQHMSVYATELRESRRAG